MVSKNFNLDVNTLNAQTYLSLANRMPDLLIVSHILNSIHKQTENL